MSTARSVRRGRPAILAVALAALASSWATLPPRRADAGEKTRYSCKDAPWAGDDERFVREMLLKWREDYGRLSIGELRIYIREVLLGLQPPGERYAIETGKKGAIRFEREDGVIRCAIEKP